MKDEKNGQRHGGKEKREEERKDDCGAGRRGVAAMRVERNKRNVRGAGGEAMSQA